ncbi:MAG: glycosyltransferase family 4 protein [Acidobacteria bacterium]|nr:glycosyltransferase family 4 protein [Acidobacteriota bacterium]
MRVLSTLTYYHPHWTGLTNLARRIAEGLVRRGHTVTVLTTRHEPGLARDEMVSGIRVLRLRPWAFISRGAVAPSWPWQLARLLPEHDVVHIHTPQAEALLVAACARSLGKPVLITHHGDLVMPAGSFNRVVERTVTATMSMAGRLAHVVAPLSADYAAHSDFLAPLGSRLTPVSPPIDMPPPQPDEVAAWRQRLNLTNARIIGFAGRFVEEKGFDYLLRAIPLLEREEPAVHLLFAGEHRVVYEAFFERCSELWERHRHRLSMVGLVRDSQQLANFYALCDVFALPSRTDCLASVQVEAMLSGTPVVATDIPGAREVVQRTGMGRLCRPHDPEHLAATLLEVLRDRPQHVRPREHIRAIYDPDRSIGEYERLLQSLMASA